MHNELDLVTLLFMLCGVGLNQWLDGHFRKVSLAQQRFGVSVAILAFVVVGGQFILWLRDSPVWNITPFHVVYVLLGLISFYQAYAFYQRHKVRPSSPTSLESDA
jgi:hypothetical protein